MKSYPSFLLFFILGSFTCFSQYTETINSNRPGNSQGAFSVGTGVLQFEAGAKIGTDKHHLLQTRKEHWGIDYSMRYGFLLEELELNIMGTFLSTTAEYLSNGSKETYANFEANTVGVKYLVYDPYKNAEEKKPNLYSWRANRRFDWSQLIPAVSVYAGANFAYGDNPYLHPEEARLTPKLAIISQNNWAGGWVFVVNLIADKIGQDVASYVGMFTLTHSFSPKFAAFAEFQTIIGDYYSDELARAGFAYLAHKNFQLDIAGLINFKDTPTRLQASLGLSYRFDMHKQDQYLEQQE